LDCADEDLSEVARELAQELAAIKLSHSKQMKQVQSELRKALATGPSRSDDGAVAVQVLHDREVQRLQAEIRKLSGLHSAEYVSERTLGKALGEIRRELLDLLREMQRMTACGDAAASAEPEHLNATHREAAEEVAAIRDAIDLLGKAKDRIVGGEAPPPWLMRGYRTAVSMSHICMPAPRRRSEMQGASSHSRIPRILPAKSSFFLGAGRGRYSRVPGFSS
jgi:hypothetical protein